jgi:hypothetical protein
MHQGGATANREGAAAEVRTGGRVVREHWPMSALSRVDDGWAAACDRCLRSVHAARDVAQ